MPCSPGLDPSRWTRRSRRLLSAALKAKRTPIKSALLDQRVVAGLGNIYVCEALFRARISPKRLAASVAGARAKRLVPAIKKVLEAAIKAGGSSLRDYAKADGELGYFQHHFAVYDREGKALPRQGLPRQDQAHRAERTLDLLLPVVPEIIRLRMIRSH